MLTELDGAFHFCLELLNFKYVSSTSHMYRFLRKAHLYINALS